jgi:hypothetical protein
VVRECKKGDDPVYTVFIFVGCSPPALRSAAVADNPRIMGCGREGKKKMTHLVVAVGRGLFGFRVFFFFFFLFLFFLFFFLSFFCLSAQVRRTWRVSERPPRTCPL